MVSHPLIFLLPVQVAWSVCWKSYRLHEATCTIQTHIAECATSESLNLKGKSTGHAICKEGANENHPTPDNHRRAAALFQLQGDETTSHDGRRRESCPQH